MSLLVITLNLFFIRDLIKKKIIESIYKTNSNYNLKYIIRKKNHNSLISLVNNQILIKSYAYNFDSSFSFKILTHS